MLFLSKRVVFSFLFFLTLLSESWATHLRAGEITAVRVNCSGRTYRITITVYIDTQSPIQLGGAEEILYFGDSTFIEVPETMTVPRPDLGPNMGMATFTIEHTYSGPGRYLIRYAEPFRNKGVINLDNPLNTMFYLETSIIIDPFVGCDNAPLLLVPPIDKACTGAAWFHNPGAYDLDGDSLSYDLAVPLMEKGTPVANYRLPNAREFYDVANIPYATANEAGTGQPEFKINPKTGTITWDAPGAQGEYNIAFYIKQWRKINGVWILLGFVERDMQIVVEDCENQRPELVVPTDICVEAGTEINQDIFAFDPDSDSVKLEAFSEVFIVNPSPAMMIPGPNNGNVKHKASSPTSHAKWVFNWKTDCAHVKDQPYQVVFKVTDKPAQGVKLIDFKTWNIRVVAPAPVWKDVSVDLATRSATVEWEPYICGGTAERMEVWRRVDQYVFEPPECVTGMPDFLGYTKIAELPMGTRSYHDTNGGLGLAAGAQYCYRLVAVFKLPEGGESYLSKDTCLAPILADAPVITNVSITKTSTEAGEILVKWRSAFDISEAQFPPPYTFKVYRGEGLVGFLKPTLAGTTNNETFIDIGTAANPLNTEDVIYNYRIIQYDANNVTVDTSFAASTVRVEATSDIQRITLNWTAAVPWSNRTEAHPYHMVYRQGPTDTEPVLIDMVDVNKAGFKYVDEGQYQNTPLKSTDTYCYIIQTSGAYGNPKIAEPLLNFSQRICAQPNDTTRPCSPKLNITAVTCDEQLQYNQCGEGPFRNVVKWHEPTEECKTDIRSYNVYIADKIGGEYTLYRENLRDTIFIDADINLRSFARCYKVSSVDRSGNESDLSEEFCFDNCTNYVLPNVFTPNGDSDNEFFSAFGDPITLGPVEDAPENCARFVESVDFVVFNRWGNEVYRQLNAREEKIYLRWDGHDNDGNELATGVYYYKATVHFITVDPAKEHTDLKGWIHLIRSRP